MVPKWLKNKLIGTFFITIFFAFCNQTSSKVDESINSIKKEVQPKLDKQMDEIALKNNLYYKIDLLIKADSLSRASQLLDSVIKGYGIEDVIFVYKGMIYQKSSDYKNAMIQYNKAMQKRIFPFALVKRAELYLQLKQNSLALSDYRAAYERNFDYSLNLGNTFELMKMNDSAIKYYSIYLEHYPNDSLLGKKLKLIQRKSN